MGNNHKYQKRNKKHIRSSLTGRIINGKEVILTEEAIEYVKKIGYQVTPMNLIIGKSALMVIGLILSLTLVLIPFVSAQDALYTIDFSLRQNQIFIIIYFAIAGLLLFMKKPLFSGFMVVIGGILMAFNQINLVISLIVMGIGIILITQEGKS